MMLFIQCFNGYDKDGFWMLRGKMPVKVRYKGREITQKDLDNLERCFGEKVDDVNLCQAIIMHAMKADNALLRGALVRALETGECGPGEGRRQARALICRMRRGLGYSYTWDEHYARIRALLTSEKLAIGIAHFFHDIMGVLRVIFGAFRR